MRHISFMVCVFLCYSKVKFMFCYINLMQNKVVMNEKTDDDIYDCNDIYNLWMSERKRC